MNPKISVVWSAVLSLVTAVAGALGALWFKPLPPPPEPPSPTVPELELPLMVQGSMGRVTAIEARGRATGLRWFVDDPSQVDLVHQDATCIKVVPVAPGVTGIYAYGVSDGNAVLARCRLVVEGPRPPPNPPRPPVPPDPKPPEPRPPEPRPPEPKPPEPQPPAPIPAPGLRVLITYETGELARLPSQQMLILYARPIREYLDSKCALGSDGRTREWRIWDKDIPTKGESQVWQDAMKRPRSSLPWILISTGETGYEGPLPANVDQTLALLRKYGG